MRLALGHGPEGLPECKRKTGETIFSAQVIHRRRGRLIFMARYFFYFKTQMDLPRFSQKSWIPALPSRQNEKPAPKGLRLFEARSHRKSAQRFVERKMQPHPNLPKRTRVWWVRGLGLGTLCMAGLLALGAMGCQGSDQPRTYSEVVFHESAPSMGGMAGAIPQPSLTPPLNARPVDIRLTWNAPEEWVKKDSGGAMRVGSWLVPEPSLAHTGEMDPQAVDVSVVQLAGDAGGMQANIMRWMGQVGLISSPQEMEEMIKAAQKFKTKSGQSGIYVDLTSKLSGDITQSKSIFGAIIATGGYTVFIKAMGERGRVVAEIPRIKTFCRSLAIAGPEA
jgi:hypothetical protein